MPYFKHRIRKPCIIKMLTQDYRYMESTQEICYGFRVNIPGDRLGELGATAEAALGEMRDILAAKPPEKLESK